MNSCRVCLSFVNNVSDISEKSHNGRNLLSVLDTYKLLIEKNTNIYMCLSFQQVFNEFVNIFTGSPCYLCPMCERGLRFTYDFRKKAIKSTQFFETEIKVEIPDVEIFKESTDDSVTENCKDNTIEQQNLETESSSHQEKLRCRYCLEPILIGKDRRIHEKNHLIQNRGLECHFCHKRFGRQDLINHIKHVHLRDVSRRYYCDKCHKSFSATSTLSTHKKLKHSTIIEPISFNCYHCNKKFFEKDFLRRHIRNVHDTFQASCHYCGKGFKTKATLKTHILGVHTNVKEFICEICEKRFSTAACRINHMSKKIFSKKKH